MFGGRRLELIEEKLEGQSVQFGVRSQSETSEEYMLKELMGWRFIFMYFPVLRTAPMPCAC